MERRYLTGLQVANLSEVLRELQLLRVTREVQAVISSKEGAAGGSPGGGGALHAASKELQTIEDVIKHNDRCAVSGVGICRLLTTSQASTIESHVQPLSFRLLRLWLKSVTSILGHHH